MKAEGGGLRVGLHQRRGADAAGSANNFLTEQGQACALCFMDRNRACFVVILFHASSTTD